MGATKFPEGDFFASSSQPGGQIELKPVEGGLPIFASLDPSNEGLLTRWLKLLRLKGPWHIIYHGHTIIDASPPSAEAIYGNSKDRRSALD